MAFLRTLNDSGTEQFSSLLQTTIDEKSLDQEMTYNAEFSEPVEPSIEVTDDANFHNRFAMGKYLAEVLKPLSRQTLFTSPGIWNWLSLLWLPQLCKRQNGTLDIKNRSRYICAEGFRVNYRHLVRSSWDIYSAHGEAAELLLYSPLYQFGDVAEQFSGRQNLIGQTPIIRAAYLIYFDGEKQRPKRRVTSSEVPGSIRRFAAIIGQLERTFDIAQMSPEEIVSLLPSEFDQWTQEMHQNAFMASG